jgi:hypothetical protein
MFNSRDIQASFHEHADRFGPFVSDREVTPIDDDIPPTIRVFDTDDDIEIVSDLFPEALTTR